LAFRFKWLLLCFSQCNQPSASVFCFYCHSLSFSDYSRLFLFVRARLFRTQHPHSRRRAVWLATERNGTERNGIGWNGSNRNGSDKRVFREIGKYVYYAPCHTVFPGRLSISLSTARRHCGWPPLFFAWKMLQRLGQENAGKAGGPMKYLP